MRNIDESTDSFGVQWRLKTCHCRVARMSRVPGVATKGFANAYFSKQKVKVKSTPISSKKY